MKRDVVKYAVNTFTLHLINERCSSVKARQLEIVHVSIGFAIAGDLVRQNFWWQAIGAKSKPIIIPDLQSFGGDGLGFFHLGQEEGGDQFAGEVGGADIDPGVLVDLAAEELAAVGALFADDLGTISKGRVIDQQGAAFAGDDVLGFMERVASKIADGSQRSPFVGGHHPLGCVFDHQQVVVAGDRHDRVHLAGHTGVMDRHDRLGAGCDRCLDQLFVDVEGVFADINENRHPPTEHEGIGRGYKGVRGHDDLIPRLDVGQDGGHLQGGRAGVGE